MKVPRKLVWVTVVLLIFALIGCGTTQTQTSNNAQAQPQAQAQANSAQDNVKAMEIRVAYTTGKDSTMSAGSEAFKQLVEQKSNGKIKVNLYPDGQLGKDEAVLDSLKLGGIEITNVSTPLQNRLKEVGAFDLPYLFKDRAAVAKVANGQIWADLQKKLPSMGYVGLAMTENGYRQITNNKRPIVKPEDLKGIKLRIPSGDIRLLTFKTYGSNPVPLDFTELFSALQQGVVDGQENPLSTIQSSRFNEVQKYLSLSNHVYTPGYLIASKIWWDKVPPENQKIILEAAKEAGDKSRAYGEAADKKVVDELKAKGMQVNEVDFAAFMAASKPVYDKAKELIGADFINNLLQAVK